ncbi:MAG: phosphoenolpyruvate--protein phosphotransferase [Candidatus Latescibacteria bacterium]|nr:phosphoenolpyruvate--protein phosphotransferase [Candidatus Latescibacterota bacterium]
MTEGSEEKRVFREYTGIPGSPGIAVGPAFIYDNFNFWIDEKSIPEDRIGHEKVRFIDAVEKVIKELKTLRDKLEEKVGRENASIFDPHIMLLQDPAMIDETYGIIEQGKSAEFAFFRTTRKIIKTYERVDDVYMRERITDIRDILRRVTNTLLGAENATIPNLESPVIIIAPNLTPSDTAAMHSSKVLAFVTDVGGRTSHASILARAIEIPAVLGVSKASSDITPGDMVIVDGTRGRVIVNPDAETLERYREYELYLDEIRKSLDELRELPAVTTDGCRVGLQANIEFTDEIRSVDANGGEGIGLYRSEYHFLIRNRVPTEDDLYKDYAAVAEGLAPRPVIIRTLDVGGDKISHIIPSEPEANPFLGWRAIRVSLTLTDLFRMQLRSILRASTMKNVAVMFPMISCMDELNEAIEILGEVKDGLRKEGIDFDPDMRVGVMIEVPSAVMIAKNLAKKVNFFSIGTNDLIQYSVAVDRANNRIANLFEPLHPGILRLIKIAVDAAHDNGIPIAVCGEMSGDPLTATALLGLGVDELSMAPSVIPSIKQTIRSISMEEVKRTMGKALECETAGEVKALIEDTLESVHYN